MRAELGAVVLIGAYLFAGFGVLLAARLVPLGRGLLPALGMAYLAGLAAVVLVQSWLLVVGIPSDSIVFLAVAALIGGGGLLVARRRGLLAPPPAPGDAVPRWRPERVAVAVMVVLLAVLFVLGALGSVRMNLDQWDAWSIWARKGRFLFDNGTIPSQFFTSDAYAFMHPDYPLFVPLMEANWFRLGGGLDTQSLHLQFWLLLAGFVGAAAWVVGRETPAIAYLPVLLLVGFAPGFRNQLLTMYADVPMALFLGLGALLAGRWLQTGDRAQLGLGVLMLAAAAAMKNEGTIGAFSVVVALVAVALVRQPGSLRDRARGAAPALIAAGALVVTLLPWRLWLAAQGIKGDLKLSNGLSPAYLADHADRVGPAFEGITNQLTDQSGFMFLFPLGVALALAGAFVPRLRAVSAFYLVAGLLVFGGLLWGYWISHIEIAYHLATSVTRVIVAVVLIATAALLHLVSMSAAERDPA